ncbi:hypothetical protein BDV93DRAFT_452969 [Ceratobasidium sp. AG-I]|nr:hypothetical protein BDV93DRAFT_452969 [Ceratobasidium sp. AG-I]
MQIRDSLASTPYAFLVEDSAITSDEAPVPPLAHSSITPLDPGLESLTTEEPATEREAKLQNALAFMLERDRKREEAERVAIATMVLQDLYCTRLKRQLMGREEKGNEESGRLMEDGMPAVLTDDAFYGRVVDKREKRQQEEDRQQDTANAKEKYRQAMHKWSLEDRERVKKNKLAAEQWKEDVKRWTIERDVARVAGRRVGRKKPIRPARTKAKPRPKLTLPSHESSSGEDSVTEDEGASEEEEESD